MALSSLFLHCKFIFQCDRDMCIANKFGFASPKGRIYKNGLRNYITEIHLSNGTETTEEVLGKCADENLNKYGPKDICELKKLKLCIHLRFLSVCNYYIKYLVKVRSYGAYRFLSHVCLNIG